MASRRRPQAALGDAGDLVGAPVRLPLRMLHELQVGGRRRDRTAVELGLRQQRRMLVAADRADVVHAVHRRVPGAGQALDRAERDSGRSCAADSTGQVKR